MGVVFSKCPLLGIFFIKTKIIILYYPVESFTITTINFSIHGSNKRFFDKLYEGSRAESSIYAVKIT